MPWRSMIKVSGGTNRSSRIEFRPQDYALVGTEFFWTFSEEFDTPFARLAFVVVLLAM